MRLLFTGATGTINLTSKITKLDLIMMAQVHLPTIQLTKVCLL